MNQLIEAQTEVKTFLNRFPTLAARRRALGKEGRLADPSTVTQHVGGILHNAGMSYLERIHTELTAANPNWRKDDDVPKAKQLTVKDLVPEVKKKAPAPTLTDAYLETLGLPTSLASMSGTPTAEAMAKLNINPSTFQEAA